MLVSLTVGKVDAGVAVLLTDDKRLIEFPSILLPADIHSGSIVDVDVSRNLDAEAQAAKSFKALQSQILSAFGSQTPETPVLRCRNATQTSVVLDWDPISVATADLRSLTLYRNGSKAGAIPKPFEITSTKISGLAVDSPYTFSLVLRTSAGTYSSEKLNVRTHKMTDLTGITITPGIMPPQLRESLESTVQRMGAKLIDQVRIDTTHFVCTEGRGSAWEKASEMNVAIVLPDWVKGCEREGRIVSVRGYYLNADPKLRQVGPGVGLQREESQQSVVSSQREAGEEAQAKRLETPTTQVTPPTPETSRRPGITEEDEEDDDEEEEDDQDEKPDGLPRGPPTGDERSSVDSDEAVPPPKQIAEHEEKSNESDETDDNASARGLGIQKAAAGADGPEASPREGSFDDVKL